MLLCDSFLPTHNGLSKIKGEGIVSGSFIRHHGFFRQSILFRYGDFLLAMSAPAGFTRKAIGGRCVLMAIRTYVFDSHGKTPPIVKSDYHLFLSTIGSREKGL